MKKKTELRIYDQQLNLREPKEINAYVQTEYNASLFDFAYLLAIALNEEFLPPHRKRSYFGYREELKRYKRILERTKKQLPEKPFFKRLLLLIDEYLDDINIGLDATRKPSGIPVEKRTKLVLLWTYILRKGKIISEKATSLEKESRLMEEIHGVIRTVDWQDFFKLLKWFYLKLENCSYSSFLKPKEDKQKEERYSKSLLEKHFDIEDNTTHWKEAKNTIWSYKDLQRYLKTSYKYLAKHTKRLELLNIKPYPIIKVNFNSDSIEIGELREHKTVMKKYSSIEKKKIPDYEEHEEDKPAKKDPIVIFHDGDVFTAENYVPPFHYYDESLLREWLEKIKSNSA